MPRTNNIKHLRMQAQIKTIEEAAEKYGCCVTMVSMMERGQRNPGLGLTLRMCEVLGCSYEDIHGKEKTDKLKELIIKK